jgi:hypothetical protein
MGYRIAWIARAGSSTAELLALSQRYRTGERRDFPDVGWYLLELPTRPGQTPWVLLIADGSDNYSGLDPSQAQLLSADGNQTLYYWCSDTIMVTDLFCFQNNAVAWSIQYDCGAKSKRPALTGNVPDAVHEILKDLRSKQDADDGADYIYELTADVGRSLVGFRHDVDLQIDDPEPFQVLTLPKEKQRAWWRFW